LTAFNLLQLALASTAVWMIGLRIRLLWFEAPLDTGTFIEALTAAVSGHQLGLARRIAAACSPAWVANLAASALAAIEVGRGDSIDAVIEETRSHLRQSAFRGHATIAALGRMASPLALIGVVLELGHAFHGDGGLLGLQRGLPMRLALERSLLTFALGLATSVVCFVAVGALQRGARELDRDLTRVVSALAERKPELRGS
jgi:biopolymer transport protein ExbB/TolQ